MNKDAPREKLVAKCLDPLNHHVQLRDDSFLKGLEDNVDAAAYELCSALRAQVGERNA